MNDQELADLIRAKIRELNGLIQQTVSRNINVEIHVHPYEMYNVATSSQVENLELSVRLRKTI